MIGVPILNERYHFFDDGKLSASRHHIATVVKIMTVGEALESNPTVYEKWKHYSTYPYNRLYAKDTDYIVGADIPSFDDNTIWFARTILGGWFSFNVNGYWQEGRLDVDERMFNMLNDR